MDPYTRGRSTVRSKTWSKRAHSQDGDRPTMSEWRIILLGKNVTENGRVGDLLSKIAVFESEGRQEMRHITIIKTPDLLKSDLSLRHISRGVRESLSQSAPGPHAFILVLQHNDFTEEDKYRVKLVLKEFSEQAIKRTIVMTTDKSSYRATVTSWVQYNAVDKLIQVCGGRHIQFNSKAQECYTNIYKTIEKIIMEQNEEYLFKRKEVDEESSISEDSAREEEEEEDSDHREDEKQEMSHRKIKSRIESLPLRLRFRESTVQNPRHDQPKRGVRKKELNLMLCGSDRTQKRSISKLLRGKQQFSTTHQKESTQVCVKKEKVDGWQITVVELPSLSNTQLSEEEVIHESLRCVSLCDPGVHVFLFIVPVGPLTDEDRAEIKTVQRIFDSRDHFMVLFTTDVTVEESITNYIHCKKPDQDLTSFCGGRYKLLGLKEHEKRRQISELLDSLKKDKTEPYSFHMYIKAKENRVRQELEEKHKAELKKFKELQHMIKTEGEEDAPSDSGCLRVVLIGKTGNGKSETGNTILGRKEFHTKTSLDSITTVCMKGVGEVQGKSIAVVDTPGLFDTTLANEQVQEEIVKCISLSAPGPHVFIIVLSVGRFTKEEMDTLSMIKMIFGSKAAQFSIVLFTRGDDLENETIEEYVETSTNAELKKMIRDCGNRVLVFNNKNKQDRTQVTKLLNMIEDVKKSNHGQYFTNEMFQEAEMSIRKKVEEILKEKEREIQLQNEELKTKYETEMENMMKRLEEEKRRADEERQLMESKFKEKEETLRKEFEEKENSEQKNRETEDQKRSEEDKQQKAKYEQKFKEIRQEIENQRSQYEKQRKEREVEDRKREEKNIQDQEKLKHEQKYAIEELKKKQVEEIEKRDLEEKKRIQEEEDERHRWKNKIKDAENDRKEIQEDIKRQQREWEEKMKLQMRDREEDEKKRKERHDEQLREKQDELERMRNKFEREKEEEQHQREKERQQWRDTMKRDNEQKEREYEERKNEMKKHYEQLERDRKEEWERRKREDNDKREEERKRWEKMKEDLKQEQEEEIKRRETDEQARKEREEKERSEMKQKHEEEMEKVKMKHKDEARKHAEEFNEFRDQKEQHIQELTKMLEERQKEYELLEKLCQHLKKEKSKEAEELKEEIEKLKKRKDCSIL